jgi:hypothetical protein
MNRELGISTPPPPEKKDRPLFSGSTETASTVNGMKIGHTGDLSYSKWVNPFDIAEEENLVPDVWISPFDN